jgi:hypothetical protein
MRIGSWLVFYFFGIQTYRYTSDLLKYLDELVDKRAADLKDDLISTLISEQVCPSSQPTTTTYILY